MVIFRLEVQHRQIFPQTKIYTPNCTNCASFRYFQHILFLYLKICCCLIIVLFYCYWLRKNIDYGISALSFYQPHLVGIMTEQLLREIRFCSKVILKSTLNNLYETPSLQKRFSKCSPNTTVILSLINTLSHGLQETVALFDCSSILTIRIIG